MLTTAHLLRARMAKTPDRQSEPNPWKGSAAGVGGRRKPKANAKVVRPDVKVFIAEYKIDRNGRRAAIAAGYSERSADSTASRLLRSAKVAAEVAQHRADAIAKVQVETGITLDRTLREIARGAFFDARRLFDHNGIPIPIQSLDDDTASVLAGMDVLEEYRGTGEDRQFVGYVKKYKLSDRKGYLDMLMKHLGGYEVDNEQKADALMPALTGLAAARRIAFALQLGLKEAATQKAKA